MDDDDETLGRAAPERRATPSSSPSSAARRRPSRRTLDDDPTVVEDQPQAPPTAPGPSAYPGGLRRLADRYRLDEPIASGGAAVVWRAFDEVLARTVAIKLLHPHLAGDPRTVERFRMESVNAARLAHPNVVAIYDTGQEQDVVYLVMEHVEGPTLREVLQDATGGLEPELVAGLGEQVANALGEAHEAGLVHRDVKPANILLTEDGLAKVTDFGIAKALEGDEANLVTAPGTLIGTAAYIAPEQIADEGTADARADVYALGVVLHECLTGVRAFSGDTAAATAAARLQRELLPPSQVRAGVPRALDDVIVRATRRDPAMRFRNGTEFGQALAAAVRSRPDDAAARLLHHDHTGHLDADRTVEQPRRLAAKVGTAFLAGLVIALVGVAMLSGSDATDATDATAAGEALSEDDEEFFAVADFDPYGDRVENPDQLAALRDSDPETTWSTVTYRAPLASVGIPGVGVWVDLGETRTVDRISLGGLTQGSALEVAVRTEPPALGDTEVAWETVVRDAQTSTSEEYALESPVSSRWWLIWFTELVASGDGWSASLGDVRLTSSEPSG